MGDRALDAGQPRQKPVALAHDRQGAQVAQRHAQHAGHAAQQVALDRREPVAVARQHHGAAGAGGAVLDLHGDGRTGAEAIDFELVRLAAGDGDQCLARGAVHAEADRRHDLAVADASGHLGLDGLGGMLDGPGRSGGFVPVGRDRREEFGELLRPPVGVCAHPSPEREHDQGLVVKAGDAARAGDLSVGVEAGDGRAACVPGHVVDLGLDPFVAQNPAAGDAIEGHEADGGARAERGQRRHAGGVGGGEDGVVVALHEPGQAALRHLGDALQRALVEVGVADEADLLLAVVAREPEGVG